ncbi:MAG: DUF86 domain-containing protein [Cyanobacteria bacterium P01_D01_bin.1]
MPKNRDLPSLLDIEQAANKAIAFLQDTDSREALMEDDKTQAAIVFQLLVIGEATKRLSRTLREQYSDIPWSLMAGMRDNLIHEYDNIDVDQVWKTVKKNLPNLLLALKPIRQGIQQIKLQLEDDSL